MYVVRTLAYLWNKYNISLTFLVPVLKGMFNKKNQEILSNSHISNFNTVSNLNFKQYIERVLFRDQLS